MNGRTLRVVGILLGGFALILGYQNFAPYEASSIDATIMSTAEQAKLHVRLGFSDGTSIARLRTGNVPYAAPDIQRVHIAITKNGRLLKEMHWERRSLNDILSDQYDLDVPKLAGLSVKSKIEIKDPTTSETYNFASQTTIDVNESNSAINLILVKN